MHSSYALSADDFAVERGARASSGLDSLWPGGWRPDDRLGVVLAHPMDACGCSNLICATTTLFYDHLRATRGTGNFFRYADNFLFGVGCEPGDFNQLDVWPLHKFVTLLQPTAEALIEAVTDRAITLLAVPETGARCRGEVILSTWNTFLESVRCIVTYSPLTGRARNADLHLVGNRVVESYVEQAIFSTPGHRRRAAGAPAPPAPEPRPRGEAAGGELPDAGQPGRRPRPPGRHVGAPARPPGADPALHPDHDHAGRGADAELDGAPPPPPFDLAAAAALQVGEPAPSGVYPDGLLRTAFDSVQRRLGATFAEWEGWDWISDFGDPVAEHHAVRESVGIWDESPLRKWLFKGPDGLAAADRCFTSDMAALAIGQCRYGPFCDEHGRMLGDGVVYRNGDGRRRPGGDGAGVGRRPLPPCLRATWTWRSRSGRWRCRTCRCRARARASSWPR